MTQTLAEFAVESATLNLVLGTQKISFRLSRFVQAKRWNKIAFKGINKIHKD